MDILYYGHSCFKLKGKQGTVVCDPFAEYVGWQMPSMSADVVTVSHHHEDHNAVTKVSGTARRQKPFVIDQLGEYEVGGISVFGVSSFHDSNQGVERGRNTIFTVLVDDILVCHLGDLGHELTAEQITAIGDVDVLLCPVGGVFTIDPALAVKTIQSLEPSIVIPMHYKTERHNPQVFSELKTVAEFCQEYGAQPEPVAKLTLDKARLPEETELAILHVTT